ncbi:MAG: hypothetical protein ACKVIH_07475 [Burkholderiales bacterium]
MIFGVTWLAGWGFSALLLAAGMGNLALRYAISFALSYPVFILCVRIWADFMRKERPTNGDLGWHGDIPGADAEGCLIVVFAFLLGLAFAAIFAMIGGPTLLLEVAFEFVFSGTLVRRMGRVELVGDWLGSLVRKTLPLALGVLLALVGMAYWLQLKVPGAQTLGQATGVILK